MVSPDGVLTPNPDASLFIQQDKLLTYWLLSTINASLLYCFTTAKIACEVWSNANRLFAAATGTKLSRMKHDLHSIKKGALTIKEYIAKIQNTCALLDAFGSVVLEAEKVEIILVGLSSDYDEVITLASFSSETLPFQKIVDVLLEFKNCQTRAVHDEPLHANMVEVSTTTTVADSDRGCCSACNLRGRGFNLGYNVRSAVFMAIWCSVASTV